MRELLFLMFSFFCVSIVEVRDEGASFLRTYWEVGQYISEKLKTSQWGTNVVNELADYLKRQNPKRRGFGRRHLYNMVKFYEVYSASQFVVILLRICICLNLCNYQLHKFKIHL